MNTMAVQDAISGWSLVVGAVYQDVMKAGAENILQGN